VNLDEAPKADHEIYGVQHHARNALVRVIHVCTLLLLTVVIIDSN
jgi:hypothetical protein